MIDRIEPFIWVAIGIEPCIATIIVLVVGRRKL